MHHIAYCILLNVIYLVYNCSVDFLICNITIIY